MIALLRGVAGLVVWAIAFSALYGLQGLVCALGWHDVGLGPVSPGRLLLVLLWLGSVALLGWMCWRFWKHPRHHRRFFDHMAAANALIGLVATAYTGSPVVWTSMCLV